MCVCVCVCSLEPSSQQLNEAASEGTNALHHLTASPSCSCTSCAKCPLQYPRYRDAPVPGTVAAVGFPGLLRVKVITIVRSRLDRLFSIICFVRLVCIVRVVRNVSGIVRIVRLASAVSIIRIVRLSGLLVSGLSVLSGLSGLLAIRILFGSPEVSYQRCQIVRVIRAVELLGLLGL